ncbi:hypothetical protein [Bacillus testis]|uniref:hypothetical protein n=1 Tax=Bacillus testis TaxID=1622072 RepID=UPI00067F17F4|nr:hypothetical protein [Bacillus testis]
MLVNGVERVEIDGIKLDVRVQKTPDGDYIGYACRPDGEDFAVGRHKDRRVARETCVKNFVSNKELFR